MEKKGSELHTFELEHNIFQDPMQKALFQRNWVILTLDLCPKQRSNPFLDRLMQLQNQCYWHAIIMFRTLMSGYDFLLNVIAYCILACVYVWGCDYRRSLVWE